MIKVLYNALHLTGQFSGVQNTIEQLMKEALMNPADNIDLEILYPANYQIDAFARSSQKTTKININTSHRWKRIGYEHLLMNNYFKKKEKQILHCPAYIRPWNWNALSVVTIHDIIALDFPEYCSSMNRLYFNLLLPRSILKADKIITMSRIVKEDIILKFNIKPDKIHFIYPGINEMYFTNQPEEKLINISVKYKLPEKFILYIGNIEPKKNISRLIESFENLIHKYDIPHSLVIAGRFAWKYILSLITCLIKLAGYIEKVLLAYYWGTSYDADSYNAIFTFIISILVFFREIIEPGFLNVFLKIKHESGEKDAWKVFFSLFWCIFPIALLAFLVLFCFPDTITHLVLPGFSGERLTLSGDLMKAASLSCVFIIISTLTNITLIALSFYYIVCHRQKE